MSDYSHKDQNFGTLPVLPVKDVDNAIDYYVEVLGFKEVFRQRGENGLCFNGQVQLENCHLMFNLNPGDAGKEGGGVYFWVRIDNLDIDAMYQRIKEKDVKIVEEIKDQFWGDRSFSMQDKHGYYLAFNKVLKS